MDQTKHYRKDDGPKSNVVFLCEYDPILLVMTTFMGVVLGIAIGRALFYVIVLDPWQVLENYFYETY
eukprot:CAMPEP_0194372946 /NCGR_PEP_ID=MMETSP0174-20130528/21363_1 /TAXON_ID=216777 /ORGANISM="Proboscia alata, Strain PI-D3" /LENGTH=66 /DNA_ID=CAMNT_0039151739 /DNA_START=31 /DNA_END=234 /DNA_ORIENTATION=-